MAELWNIRASDGTGPSVQSSGSEGPIAGPEGPTPGSRNPQQVAAQRRLQQTQAQVDEVVDLMKTNVEKVLERDHKLNELEMRADGLEEGASRFEKQAKSLKSKFWLENMKMIVIGFVVLVLIGILIYWFSGASTVVDAVTSDDKSPPTTQPSPTPKPGASTKSATKTHDQPPKKPRVQEPKAKSESPDSTKIESPVPDFLNDLFQELGFGHHTQ